MGWRQIVSEDRLRQALGKFVVGDEFWDREKDVELLTEHIEHGAHVLLVAQRRMGKTSLMKETARRLEDRFVCLFVDLQECAGPPDAMVELSLAIHPHKSLWGKARDVFANVLDRAVDRIEKIDTGELGVTLRAGVTGGDWAAKGDRLLAILADADEPVVLMLDEIPIMVSRMLKGKDYAITPERTAATDEFMSWLRKSSIRHQGEVSFVLSGSIGLEPILRQARLSSAVNNFARFELRPWGETTAAACLRALASEYGVELGDGVPEKMLRLLGCCIPHHVQMFFAYAYETCRRRGRFTFTADDAKDVYQREMLGTRGHVELTHYEERLEMVLGKALFPLALVRCFGASHMGAIYGLSNSFFLIGNAQGPFIGAYIYDTTGSARPVYALACVLFVVSTLLISLIRQEGRKA